MAFEITDYSRKQSLDLSSAIAEALARHLREAFFDLPGVGITQFAQVFEDWPSFEDNHTTPSACILPDAPLVYGDSHMSPTLLEETWEPVGEPGYGLYKLAEGLRELEVTIRAATATERNAVLQALEERAQGSPATGMPGPSLYGKILTMTTYYDLPARVSLQESRKLDNAQSAAQNIWEASMMISVQAPKVQLGRVQPFTVKTKEIVLEGPVKCWPPA